MSTTAQHALLIKFLNVFADVFVFSFAPIDYLREASGLLS